MDLDLIISQNNVFNVITHQKELLDELKRKGSNRTDLLETLEKNIQNLTESYLRFKQLDADFRQASRMNGHLQARVLHLEAELIRLREQNEELKRGL